DRRALGGQLRAVHRLSSRIESLDLLDLGGGRGALTGSQGLEDRVEVLHRPGVAADHQAVAALLAPDAAGGADVEVVDALARQFLAAVNVIDVVRVAAVDQDIAL